MLILTRRIGESVYIGDEVRMTVLGVRGAQVRLGINAPKDVPVHREEIYYKIKHEQAAGQHTPGDQYPQPADRHTGENYGNVRETSDANQWSGESADASERKAYDDEPDPHNV